MQKNSTYHDCYDVFVDKEEWCVRQCTRCRCCMGKRFFSNVGGPAIHSKVSSVSTVVNLQPWPMMYGCGTCKLMALAQCRICEHSMLFGPSSEPRSWKLRSGRIWCISMSKRRSRAQVCSRNPRSPSLRLCPRLTLPGCRGRQHCLPLHPSPHHRRPTKAEARHPLDPLQQRMGLTRARHQHQHECKSRPHNCLCRPRSRACPRPGELLRHYRWRSARPLTWPS